MIEEPAIDPMQRGNLQPKALADCQKCGAKTRSGAACCSPAVFSKRRCRIHGGGKGSGASNRNANGRYRAGLFTHEMIPERRELAGLLRELPDFQRLIGGV